MGPVTEAGSQEGQMVFLGFHTKYSPWLGYVMAMSWPYPDCLLEILGPSQSGHLPLTGVPFWTG